MAAYKFLGDLIARYVGIGGATADSSNPLSVRGSGSLFDGDTEGHKIQVNKAAVSDTASFILQTGLSDRAELGLIGDDNLELKVSDDGSIFKQAFDINNTTAVTDFKQEPTYLGQSIWHEGNDGSGSGLDADTVDGHNASAFASTDHVYHNLVENTYYYDDYNQRRNLRWVGENAFSDIFEYRQIEEVEYHDGTNWVSWTDGFDLVKLMFDGNENTVASIPRTHRRFRFKVHVSTGWPTFTLLMLQTNWASMTYPSTSIIVSDSQTLSGTYTEQVNLVFNSSTSGSNWGIHGYYTQNFHNGLQWNWIEIAIDDWGDNTKKYPIRRLSCFSSFSGTPKGTFYTDYDQKTIFRGQIETPLIGVNGQSTDSITRFAIQSNESMFNHNGNGHKIKINKNSSGDSVEIDFQSSFTTKARLGLLNNNSFTLKVGSSFKTVLTATESGYLTSNFGFGVGRQVPSDFWAGNTSSTDAILMMDKGYFGHNDSYEQGFWWNGYRNTSGGWTSFNINNYTTAAGISLGNTGIHVRWEDSPSGISPVILYSFESNQFIPAHDNVRNLGTASKRWKEVFSGNPSISTSDQRLKIQIDPDESTCSQEEAAAKEIKQSIKRYQMKDSFLKKGKKARIHFGVFAQEIREILSKHELDAGQYSFFCEDEVMIDEEYEDGGEIMVRQVSSGETIMGIRYEELLCFILAYT